MKVLIACEYSGVVRNAFARLGHHAVSCDLLESEDWTGGHYQGDVRDLFGGQWDLMIAHPPCTHLSVSGARHFAAKRADGRQQEAVDFFMDMVNAPIPRIAVENPVCIMSSLYRKPDQIIQPFEFGHPERKATCLWLKGLPRLVPTNDVREQMRGLPKAVTERIHRMPPSPTRWKDRSRTFEGIAEAMADQWSRAMLAEAA